MFFDSPKPYVSKEEFKKARSFLSGKGFSTEELNNVERMFASDLLERGVTSRDKGISRDEITACTTWMRANPHKHKFSPAKIDLIEEALMKKL